MKKLKLYLSPINGGIKFRINADKYGEIESSLPFSDGNEDAKLFTVLNALNTFSLKYEHRLNDDKDWMVEEGILFKDNDEYFFHEKMRENIGRKIYKALFPEEIRETLYSKLGATRSEEDLHIQIQYHADAITKSRLPLYPWQIAHNGAYFLAGRVNFSYLVAHRNTLPVGKKKVKQIKILLISSSASEKDNQKLRNKELIIINGIRKAEEKGRAYLLNWYKSNQTYRQLTTYLTDNLNENKKLPDIIHFDGHGIFKKECKNPFCPENGTNKIYFHINQSRCKFCDTPLGNPSGFLLFEDEKGNPDYISAERFTHAVEISKPKLVVITACKSALAHQSESVFNGIAQSLIRVVPAVVATPFNISEDSAIDFVEEFYRSLGAKQSLLKSVKLASRMMRYSNYEWYRPVIFLRHDGDEDGYLFDFIDDDSKIDGHKQDYKLESELEPQQLWLRISKQISSTNNFSVRPLEIKVADIKLYRKKKMLPEYPLGTRMRCYLKLEKPSYVILISKFTSGTIWCISPTSLVFNNYHQKGEFVCPDPNHEELPYLELEGDLGVEEWIAITCFRKPKLNWLPQDDSELSKQDPMELSSSELNDLLNYVRSEDCEVMGFRYKITA